MRLLRSIGWRLLAMLAIAGFYALLRQGFGVRLTPFRAPRPGDRCSVAGMRTLGKASDAHALPPSARAGEFTTTLLCRDGHWILPYAP